MNSKLSINEQDKVRRLIYAIPVGLLITTPEGIIECTNPAGAEMFRCEFEDLCDRSVRELFSQAEDTNADDFFASSHDKTREVMAQRADGTKFPAAVRVIEYFSGSGPSRLVVVEDVSAKHEVERLKQEFISMISHDLRTPLTSVNALLNLVTEGLYDQRPGELKERTRAAEGEIARLIGMVNNLLDLNKLEAGRLKLCIDPIPVAQIVSRSLQSIVVWAQTRTVILEIPQIPDELLVRADSEYTIQVLVNLLSNAIKFSPSGSAVTVSVAVEDRFVKIMVVDRGRGIPADFLSKLFNRFEQARLSDARVEGGTGLGLAISKAIVEEQGGTIGVTSEPGRGCTFWFTIPRETDAANVAASLA